MEEAVTELEAMFQKAETDLNYLSLKLEAELQSAEGNASQTKEKLNPQKLLTQINEIKAEHSRLLNEVSEIQRIQRETTDAIVAQVLCATQKLQSLQDITGVPGKDYDTSQVGKLLSLGQVGNTAGTPDTRRTHQQISSSRVS